MVSLERISCMKKLDFFVPVAFRYGLERPLYAFRKTEFLHRAM
jgi:hypothetical protein